jgi:hypothetical protein
MENMLYYGDNLDILQRNIPDESVEFRRAAVDRCQNLPVVQEGVWTWNRLNYFFGKV